MNWKTKSFIQNLISMLPDIFSDKIYYFVQRKFGDLKTVDPLERLTGGITIYNLIKSQNKVFEEKVFFELGTGRRLNLPFSLWLMNSGKIMTVDLNNYLKKELIQKDLEFIDQNKEKIKALFAITKYDDKKLEELISLSKSNWKIHDLLNLCNIECLTNCDARQLQLKSSLIDYYISYTVLEHIPPKELFEIFEEAKRVLNEEGLMIHFIDYRDHFWYSDKTISPINFLSYNDNTWKSLSDNKFMYMNRLRHDDYINIFKKLFLEILNTKTYSENLLTEDKKLDQQFMNKSIEVLNILDSWFVIKNKRQMLQVSSKG